MALAGLILAQGVVPNSKTSVYSGVVGKVTYVKSFIFHNTDVNVETIVVYLKDSGGTSKIVAQVDLTEGQTFTINPKSPWHLEESDEIEITTTNAASVNYWISGFEMDIPASGITPYHLADGQAVGATPIVYIVPGATITYISSMTFFNTGANAGNLNVYIDTGTVYQILRLTLQPNEAFYWDTPIILEAAHEIQLTPQYDNEVDYWIDGMEEA